MGTPALSLATCETTSKSPSLKRFSDNCKMGSFKDWAVVRIQMKYCIHKVLITVQDT